MNGELAAALTEALYDTQTRGGWWGRPECEEFGRLVAPKLSGWMEAHDAEVIRAFVGKVASDHAFNGAHDPGQRFYDWGLNPWLDTVAEQVIAQNSE